MPSLSAAMLIAASVIVWLVRRHPCSFGASSGLAGVTAAMSIIALGELAPLIMVLLNWALPFGIHDPAWSAAHGMPSFGALAGYLIIGFAGACGLFEDGRWAGLHRFCGVLVAGIGGYALVGYAVGVPALFFYVPGVSAAMAIPTALAFIALGLALVMDEQMLELMEST